MSNPIDIDALFKIQYGLYIVTTVLGEKLNGQVATTVMQVTSTPIKLAVCLSKNTLTHEMLLTSKVFGVSILAEDTPMAFIGTFGFKCGRNTDKCANVAYKKNLTGCPLIQDHTLATLEAKVEQELDLGTHTIFVGELLSAEKVRDGAALTYEYYHTVIRGKSPENAPTHI
jgi:ferric-chelate reductase [NAD(P)H]